MMSVGYRKEQVLNRLSRLEENCTLRVTMLGFEILNGELCNDLNKKYLKVKVRANNKDIFNQTIPGQIKELPICRTVLYCVSCVRKGSLGDQGNNLSKKSRK